ncbi:hypothetical protein HZH66_005832 [Vespula vulgaris]|uniref:Uncharacterized protein n=1 Tax=Vespula vulgaris TaxID=7454 RepID=A0A834K5V7_VESVU|nr:hypothetical protein HZH66_005832 [Vespula vulgaris]
MASASAIVKPWADYDARVFCASGYVFGDGGDGTADRGGPNGDIRRFESAAASLVPLSARRLYTDAMRPAAAAVAVAVATTTTTTTITITSITNIATTASTTTTTTTTTTTSVSTTTSTTITATTTSTYHRDT